MLIYIMSLCSENKNKTIMCIILKKKIQSSNDNIYTTCIFYEHQLK